MATRRYIFKLYPTADQDAVLHNHRRMIADLWNALLERYETIQRRTVQRQVWHDAAGKRHSGISVHNPAWRSVRYAKGEIAMMPPGPTGLPKPFTAYDMQNEVTHLCNECPEWRELSVWCGHRTAALLDRAIQAFYRRAKEGAGARSGYPRFKRRDRHDGIPHRSASGCRLAADPRHETSWTLKVKGVPGTIHARGALPAEALKWADADLIWRAGQWWFSVCVEMDARRSAGRRRVTIDFDLLDEFARVNGVGETPAGLHRAMAMQDMVDALKSERDTRWPRGRRLNDLERGELLDANREIARLSAKAARVRANALHVWTSRIVCWAGDITIMAPPVREATASPRGDERYWGAHVEVVSDLNRHTLLQAPATAIAMLRYKAEEAGIRCDVTTDETPKIAAGGDLATAGRELRKARRQLRRAA